MPAKIITYCNQQVKVSCDGNCVKAWGISCRPKIKLSEDEDDVVYLADGELGEAPENPGTSEGFQCKPLSAQAFPNKWCVRECERCTMVDDDKPIVLKNWSNRVYNLKWRNDENSKGEVAMKQQRNLRNFERFTRRNIAHLARACWLASAWQESCADAEKDCDPALSRECLMDKRRMLKLEKTLKRYMQALKTR